MVCYSHSRVSTFENCPYKYKLQYIERKKPDIPTTIEPFMGDMVHQTLEHLYKLKMFKKRIALNSLIKFYRDLWKKNYSEDILIAKAESENVTSENYRKMGEEMIKNYYERMKPFEEMIILGLETQDRMTLPDGNQWHVRIDKLGCDSEGNYFVCDYKTNSRMKDQEEADSDRQLALYSVWVKDKFKDAKSVKLIWHMLAFNKDAVSERTEEQLKKLQDDAVDLINQIKKAEEEKNFPTNVTGLCSYCGFKSECPSFKHQAELELIEDVKEFKEDDGVKLVDEFSEIKLKKKELEDREDVLKKELIEFAKQKNLNVVYGSNMKCGVKEFDKIVLPEDKAELIKLMKEKGVWDEVSMINFMGFQSKVLKGQLDEIKNMVDVIKDYRLSLSRRKEEEGER